MAEDLRREIEDKLRAELSPTHIEVVDESHLHVGHAGAQSGKGHFRCTIASPYFEGLKPLGAQRLVYKVLATQMRDSVHALTLKTYTPQAWEKHTS